MFMELQRDWEAAGLSERVSEVNLMDIRDVRAQLAGDDSHIEIRLGSEEQGKRLKDGLEVLDGQKQSMRGSLISYIDLSQGSKRRLVGLTSGAHATEANQASNATIASTSNTTSDRETVVTATRATLGANAVRTAQAQTAKDRAAREAATDKKSDKTKPDRHR
jgi:hypothetical protein